MKPIVCNTKNNSEPHIEEIKFKIYKFSPRTNPGPRNTILIPCFSEFGTEILGTVYCLPELLNNRYMGKYSIAVGWPNRTFLYKNLVDEFWEIDKNLSWLRDYSLAFHHSSRNLWKLEKQLLKEHGKVIDSSELSEVAIYPRFAQCLRCRSNGIEVLEDRQICLECGTRYEKPGLFYNPIQAKQTAMWPNLSPEKIVEASKYIQPNSIGLTARCRKTYGRNLPFSFYERLLELLKDYHVIWLGERQSTYPCPSGVLDFSDQELELVLALVSRLKFTIQYWTASTRLAGLVGTPYINFESPDQVWGGRLTPGHEGYRTYLTTKGEKKLVVTQFNDIEVNLDKGLELTMRAIKEMKYENYDDIIWIP